MTPKDSANADDNLLTLAAAARECCVRLPVLKRLIEAGAITRGLSRSRTGHMYLHREQLPEWAEIHDHLTTIYTNQLRRTDRAVRDVEREVEAVRYDVNEALEDPALPLGDDIRAVTLYNYDVHTSKTFAGAVHTLQTAVLTLSNIRSELDEMRRVT